MCPQQPKKALFHVELPFIPQPLYEYCLHLSAWLFLVASASLDSSQVEAGHSPKLYMAQILETK